MLSFSLFVEVGSGRKSFPLKKDVFWMESDTGQICALPFVLFSGIKVCMCNFIYLFIYLFIFAG